MPRSFGVILSPLILLKSTRGTKRTRSGVELSHQVKAMLGEAAAAYIDRDFDKTMSTCQEIIRIEPAAHDAWNYLALVHEEREEFDAALRLKIMAAHLQGDSELWRELGRASRCATIILTPASHNE